MLLEKARALLSMPKFKADKEKEVRATGANWGTQT